MQHLKTLLVFDDGQRLDLLPGRAGFGEALFIEYKLQEKIDEQRLTLTIHPKRPVQLQSLTLTFQYRYGEQEQIFCNGIQSWTASRAFGPEERIRPLHAWARPFLQFMGDETFLPKGIAPDALRSWTYSTLSATGEEFWLVGALSEAACWICIEHQPQNHLLLIHADIAGLHLDHSFPVLDLLLVKGTEAEVYNRYFEVMEVKPRTSTPLWGWTSWYQYGKNIQADVLVKELEQFAAFQQLVPESGEIDSCFQVDDGWQSSVGDWLLPSKTFPAGMDSFAGDIWSKGLKPGLWLAPFAVSKTAQLVRSHPDWLVKDIKGKPLKAGYNPAWGGWFFALDLKQEAVQEYIRTVLITVVQKWGYYLLKLDFLYLAALSADENQTRGQTMAAALQLLRRAAGEAKILACGVPLGAAFGLVDYCRIGPDAHRTWEHSILKALRHRERPTMRGAIENTASRYPLHRRAFLNDADVFFLHQRKLRLSPAQCEASFAAAICGSSVIFTSDSVGKYAGETISRLLHIPLVVPSLEAVRWKRISPQAYRVFFRYDLAEFSIDIELTDGTTIWR